MTEFDKAVKRFKADLFCDFDGGLWLDTVYVPIDREYFDSVMRGVVDAHEDESAKLRELLSAALGQVREMCESNKDRCATCPLHHGNDECRMVMACDDARELGVEVDG